MDWESLGYIGMFLSGLVSATIIPMSSEAVFTGLYFNGFSGFWLVVVGSVGNTLGAMTSYFLGKYGSKLTLKKISGTSVRRIASWRGKIDKYGAFIGVLSWVPVIGDIIAAALGFFRVNLFKSTFWMLLGKVLRYCILLGALLNY